MQILAKSSGQFSIFNLSFEELHKLYTDSSCQETKSKIYQAMLDHLADPINIPEGVSADDILANLGIRQFQ